MIRRLIAAAVAILTATAAPAEPVTVVAHRGLAAGLPENTLAAFRHAIAQGVTVLELDVRSTGDGELVVLHDASVDRTTSGRGRIAHLTLAAVKALDAGSHAGARFAGERVPTLEEVFALADGRSLRLLLDIKDEVGVDPALILRLAARHRLQQRLIIGLRSLGAIVRTRALDPAVPIIAFVARPADAAGAAAAGASIVRLWSDWIDDGTGGNSAPIIAAARRLGLQVWVTVGRRLPRREPSWRALHRRLLAAGVEGLITDRPEWVAADLAR